jgi:hypothetical protein
VSLCKAVSVYDELAHRQTHLVQEMHLAWLCSLSSVAETWWHFATPTLLLLFLLLFCCGLGARFSVIRWKEYMLSWWKENMLMLSGVHCTFLMKDEPKKRKFKAFGNVKRLLLYLVYMYGPVT